MSHFTTVVILPKKVKLKISAELLGELVTDALGPFDENKEVAEYEEECYCVGNEASRDACTGELDGEHLNVLRDVFYKKNKELHDRIHAVEFGDEKETERWELKKLTREADRLWQEHSKEFFAKREAREKEHFLYKSPDPKCKECEGTGKVMSTRNPKSKWDWWTISGRWTGSFLDYEIEKDPRNYEQCELCRGTGTRRDMVSPFKKPSPAGHIVVGEGCNGCHATGWKLKWSDFAAPDRGNIALVGQLLNQPEPYIPFAVLDPKGGWHERGHMGWWASVSDEQQPEDWEEQVKDLYAQYKEHVAVLCDLHI